MTTIYNEEKKVIFIHVHKCAGNAIYQSLLNMNREQLSDEILCNTPLLNMKFEDNSDTYADLIHGNSTSNQDYESTSGWRAAHNNNHTREIMRKNSELLLGGFENPIHFRALDMRSYLGESNYCDYTSIACVRNPWKRLFSWYRFLKSDKRNPGHYNLVKNLELDEFIQFSVDHFYHPQSDWLVNEDGDIIVNELVKHEKLSTEWTILTKKYLGKELSLPLANQSKYKAEFTEFYRVRKSTLEKFRDKYAKDFELLDYDNALPPYRELNENFSQYENNLNSEIENNYQSDSAENKLTAPDETYELFRMYNSAQKYSNYIQNKLTERTKQLNHFKSKNKILKGNLRNNVDFIEKLKGRIKKLSDKNR